MDANLAKKRVLLHALAQATAHPRSDLTSFPIRAAVSLLLRISVLTAVVRLILTLLFHLSALDNFGNIEYN